MAYILPKASEASDMMWDATLGGAGPWITCSCGIEHSVPCDVDGDYDHRDNFEYVHLDGQTFVVGCDGCSKKLAKYENFIWSNRDAIRRYLKIRIDQEKAWADQEALLNTLAGI
jgi:hypothetical protein